MKKVFLVLALGIGMSSCTSNWEYRVVKIKGEVGYSSKLFDPKKFEDITGENLNIFGKKGWELVDIYEIIETVHPNFGNKDYVTGIQPNVRTAEVNFVFKRNK